MLHDLLEFLTILNQNMLSIFRTTLSLTVRVSVLNLTSPSASDIYKI